MHGHEDSSTTFILVTLFFQAGDTAVVVNLVVLEDSQRNFLMDMLLLLGSGVGFLLLLLASSAESEDKVQGRFFLDVVVSKGATIFELLSSKDQALLVWRNSLLVLDLGLDRLDRVGGVDVQGNSFPGKGLDKDLHRHGSCSNHTN